MTRHLCITVTLLDPLFHGKGDRDEPEWPPSPMRLFQALLAGSRTGCRDRGWSKAEADAFCWLEKCDPPQILASEAKPAAAYTLFVPNNDGDKKFDRQDRLTSKVARPHRLAIRDSQADHRHVLNYLWAIPEEKWPTARPHAELLCREARRLLALGWGIDQAVGDGRILTGAETAMLPGWRWRPWRNHRADRGQLRVPVQGSLNDLEAVHESFLRRVNGGQFDPSLKLSKFDKVVYLSAGASPPRSCACFELSEGTAFRQASTNRVAAMLRSLICREENRQDFQDQFAEDTEVYLAGHATGEKRTPARFSYLPLPTIGHAHADGMIRRLLIAEPYGGDGLHARWAQQRLRNQVLRDKDGEERGVLLDLWRTGSDKMVSRYTGESRSWSSVTPVILPGFDDGKRVKAEKLLVQSLEQAGVPPESVTDLTLRKAPFWSGSQHPRQYQRPKYLKHLPAWHVHLVFREPIPGPLTLGAGRHVGLGVMAAAEG